MMNNVKNTSSVFHTNICSLQYNGDDLYNLVASLEFEFDIIDHPRHGILITVQPPVLPRYATKAPSQSVPR